MPRPGERAAAGSERCRRVFELGHLRLSHPGAGLTSFQSGLRAFDFAATQPRGVPAVTDGVTAHHPWPPCTPHAPRPAILSSPKPTTPPPGGGSLADVTKEPPADSVVGCPIGAVDPADPAVRSEDFGDETVTSHHFGEEGAKLTYGSYLRLEQLLSAQVLESDPPAHDELLFITIHQVYELWFKQLLHEVDAATLAMFDGRLWWAKHLLKRVATIEDVLIRQIAVLETMTPQDFLAFRELLSPASGFQSAQFRELEFASGAKDPTYLKRFRGLTEAEQDRLARRRSEERRVGKECR